MLVVGDDGWVLWVVNKFVARRGCTADENNVVRFVRFRYRHAPCRAAFGMAGREMCNEDRPSERERLAVLNDPIDFHGRELECVSPGEVVAIARFERTGIRAAGDELRS